MANSPFLLQVIIKWWTLLQYLSAKETASRLSGLLPDLAKEINKVGVSFIKKKSGCVTRSVVAIGCVNWLVCFWMMLWAASPINAEEPAPVTIILRLLISKIGCK